MTIVMIYKMSLIKSGRMKSDLFSHLKILAELTNFAFSNLKYNKVDLIENTKSELMLNNRITEL